MSDVKIGIISCSGEECLGGTISRLATRKVLEELRPKETVTICLPLFLAGGEEERGFAKVFPTIAVDGCDKLCAKRGTEKHSGKINASIDISKIIGTENALNKKVVRNQDLKPEHFRMIDKIADEIVKAMKGVDPGASVKPCGCCCGGKC